MNHDVLLSNRDRDNIIMAKFAMALIDKDDEALARSIGELNKLADLFLNAAEGLAEAPIIELYRNIFGIYVDSGKRLEDGFLDICAKVFHGIKLRYPVETIYDAHILFHSYSMDNCKEKLQLLYQLADTFDGSILSYIICRRVLDIKMSSSGFTDDLDLVRCLIGKLDSASEEVKEASLLVGRDLFFRKSMEVQNEKGTN